MEQKYLSTKEYAKLTGMSEPALRRNVKAGKIPNGTKVGGRYKFVLPIGDDDSLRANEEVIRAIEHIANGYIELLNILKNK